MTLTTQQIQAGTGPPWRRWRESYILRMSFLELARKLGFVLIVDRGQDLGVVAALSALLRPWRQYQTLNLIRLFLPFKCLLKKFPPISYKWTHPAFLDIVHSSKT